MSGPLEKTSDQGLDDIFAVAALRIMLAHEVSRGRPVIVGQLALAVQEDVLGSGPVVFITHSPLESKSVRCRLSYTIIFKSNGIR